MGGMGGSWGIMGGLPGSSWLNTSPVVTLCYHVCTVDMNIRKHYIIKINNVTQCPAKTSWCRGYVQPALTGGPQSEPHFPGYSSECGGFEPTGRLGGQMPDETLNSPSPHRGHSFQSSLLSLHSGAFWGLAGGCP